MTLLDISFSLSRYEKVKIIGFSVMLFGMIFSAIMDYFFNIHSMSIYGIALLLSGIGSLIGIIGVIKGSNYNVTGRESSQ